MRIAAYLRVSTNQAVSRQPAGRVGGLLPATELAGGALVPGHRFGTQGKPGGTGRTYGTRASGEGWGSLVVPEHPNVPTWGHSMPNTSRTKRTTFSDRSWKLCRGGSGALTDSLKAASAERGELRFVVQEFPRRFQWVTTCFIPRLIFLCFDLFAHFTDWWAKNGGTAWRRSRCDRRLHNLREFGRGPFFLSELSDDIQAPSRFCLQRRNVDLWDDSGQLGFVTRQLKNHATVLTIAGVNHAPKPTVGIHNKVFALFVRTAGRASGTAGGVGTISLLFYVLELGFIDHCAPPESSGSCIRAGPCPRAGYHAGQWCGESPE